LPTVPQKKSIGASHIHAIVRQESEFHSKVTSPAGAKGYMQLMPATAKEVARSLNIKHQKSWLLSRPAHNVTLGSQYLDGLVYKYKNLQLAAAGYNAGPHRVSKWVDVFQDPRTPKISMVDWVELIPFSETRNYVQRVSEAEMVYRTISK
jgi:soluble lytic murein transglycosylase